MIRVAIVDDHDMVREGLRALLAGYDDLDVVAEAATVDEGVRITEQTRPDVVLLDLRMGEEDGADVARRLRANGSEVTILILSVQDTSRHLRDALQAGADGYLLKSVSAAELAEGIRRAVKGETVIGREFVPKLLEDAAQGGLESPALTPRERQVLGLVADGLGNREIGEGLGISPRTAQKHVENLFKKLEVSDRAQLVSRAFRRGLLR